MGKAVTDIYFYNMRGNLVERYQTLEMSDGEYIGQQGTKELTAFYCTMKCFSFCGAQQCSQMCMLQQLQVRPFSICWKGRGHFLVYFILFTDMVLQQIDVKCAQHFTSWSSL